MHHITRQILDNLNKSFNTGFPLPAPLPTPLGKLSFREEQKQVIAKETLQNYILVYLYNSKKYQDLIFYGGTALRKLYNLDRFSEDLDFEAESAIDLETLSNDLVHFFRSAQQYEVTANTQEGRNISRVTLKFPIMKQLGLSPYEDAVLHAKVEINSNLTGNYNTEKTPLMVDNMSAVIRHYDLPTLMAGKMTACLDRKFRKGNTGIEIKGRDYYDLIWYMNKGIVPNPQKLLDTNSIYTPTRIWELITEKIEKISRRDLYEDLRYLFPSDTYIRNWCDNFQVTYYRYLANYTRKENH